MKNIVSKIKDFFIKLILAIWNYGPFAATRGYIVNKWVSVLALWLMMRHYKSLPEQPFIELYYTAITIFSVALLGPLLRLILFGEAALYAESGGLKRDLDSNTKTINTQHYWFATAVSYLIAMLCYATVAK